MKWKMEHCGDEAAKRRSDRGLKATVAVPFVPASLRRSVVSSLRIPAKRRGAAIIEAALVLGILLSLSFGAAEAGYYLWIKHGMEGAAREGVRAAITANATNTDVDNAIYGATDAIGLPRTAITPVLTPANVQDAPEGTAVKVQVQCNWKAVGIHPLNLFGDTVGGTAVMRKEGT
jgi:Flp pilus assembly protein TadG